MDSKLNYIDAQTGEAIEDATEDVIRVKSSSNANQLAQAIAHSIYEREIKPIRAIGAGAVNQAVKALAIARGYVAPRGIDLSVKPGFETIIIDGKSVSAVTLHVRVEK